MEDNMATHKQINGGRTGRTSGFKFEQKLKIKYNGVVPENGQDLWGERSTMSKTDIIFGKKNCSIKNSETSTQIQICSAERFSRKFNLPKKVKEALDQFVGNHPLLLTKKGFKGNPTVMKEVCEQWSVKFKDLDSVSEQNRGRLTAKNIKNMSHLVDWFTNNMEDVYRFVLAESFNDPKNKDNIANTIWWSAVKDDPDSIVEFDIEKIIYQAKKKAKASIRESQTVIELGPLTLQMKGSGKSGSSYHCMQFNMSLKDLTTFMEEK